MDTPYYDFPDRPFFNKVSLYPEGYAPEDYITSYALKVGSDDKSILRLGCGWNDNSRRLVEHYGRVYNVDDNPAVIEKFKLITRTIPEMHVCLSVDGSIPFYDNFFDVILSPRGPMFSKPSIFSEVVRVLRPGGYLIATVTGEKDLLDIKKSMGRGFNFHGGDFLESVGNRIDMLNHKLGGPMDTLVFKDFSFEEVYTDRESLVRFLESFPVITDFDYGDPLDRKLLDAYMDENATPDGIKVHRQVFFWVGKRRW